MTFGADVKLVNQRNAAITSRPRRIRHLPLTSIEEIKRGKRILETLFTKGPNPLTVGDLSIVSAEKKKHKRRVEDDFDDVLDYGLGPVYFGPRPSGFQPSTPQSQKIDVARLLKHKKFMEKQFLMRNPSVVDAKIERLVLKK